jgi:septal ring factor EnvC (AmiA/AmiB activator)
MVNNIEINLIIDRAKIAFGAGTQEQLAVIFNISASDFSKRKRSGTLIKLIEKEAYLKNISYDWIKTGRGSMKSEAYSAAEYPCPDQSPTRSPMVELNHQYSDPDQLIRKTAKILRSNTSFCKALDSNIEAFHEAIVLREELDATKATLYECQNQIVEQKKSIEMMRVQHDSEMNELRAQMKAMSEKLPSAVGES